MSHPDPRARNAQREIGDTWRRKGVESRAEDEGAQDEKEKKKRRRRIYIPRHNRSNEENAFSHTRLIGVAEAVDRARSSFFVVFKTRFTQLDNVERRCYPPCPCLPYHTPPQFYPFAPIAPRSQ